MLISLIVPFIPYKAYDITKIIDEIIEHKIQDDDILSHLYDRILSIVFFEDNKKMELFYKLSGTRF